MKFTYSSGARPLDGYTIKRGIGHGGFGEVYYALSDGGKEVALKLVRSNLDVELRGVAQCLNLKHPNLVALFDMKKDGQGDSWVIMEYVAGEGLSAILNRHPRGLPLDMVRQWFVNLSRSIGYLHDNGIVHRDLKPGNIFIENGIVKVGDYGLSKFISGSQRSAQTQSVGTVHYMAPEVSTGNYGKQIDIYAAGIILYEMITGKVPFDGESAGEILMKHLTASPDLTKLPPGYAEVVGTALAKNPAHRYASFAEMARAVEHIGGKPKEAVAPEVAAPVLEKPYWPEPEPAPAPLVSFRGKVAELSGSMLLAVLVAAVCSLGWMMLAITTKSHEPNLAAFASTFFLMVMGSWAVLTPARFWEGHRGDPWLRRGVMLFFGLGLGLLAYWLNGWSLAAMLPGEPASPTSVLVADLPMDKELPLRVLFSYLAFYGLAFFLVRWWKMAERTRSRRFSFYSVLAVGVPVWILFAIIGSNTNGQMGQEMLQTPVVLMLTALTVQMSAPWQEPAPRPIRRMRLRYA